MPANKSTDIPITTQSCRSICRRFLSCAECFIQQLITRKAMIVLRSETDNKMEFKRSLNWISLFFIGLGGIVGE